jgi:hypothetical protein
VPQTAKPTSIPKQLTTHQEGRQHTPQDDIEHQAAQQQGELTNEWASFEARLADLHQRELALEVARTTTIEHAERQLPTFARASQNVVAAAVLLHTLPAPSTNGVGKVYQQLKSILGTAAA